MGAAETKNTTDLMDSVSNQISQSTSNNAAQAVSGGDNIEFRNCTVRAKGNINFKQDASIIQQVTQINKSLQNASVLNDIAQTVQQTSSSTVGALGIGFASANNSVNATVNCTSLIAQNLSNTSNQYASVGNKIDCENSTFISGGNFNIDQSTTGSFLSNQMMAGQQTATISNKISQDIKQKATAKVEGLAGLLLAIALIIGALGYSVSKPFTTGAGKFVVVVIVVIILVLIVALMYIRQTPPFFSDLPLCQPPGSSGFETCNSTCIDVSEQDVKLDTQPVKYTLAVYGASTTDAGGTHVNLAKQVINAIQKQAVDTGDKNNAGYNMSIYAQLEKYLSDITQTLNNAGIYSSWQNADKTNRHIIPNPLAKPTIDPTTRDGDTATYGYLIPSEFLQGPGDKNVGSCTPGAASSIAPANPSENCDYDSSVQLCPVNDPNTKGSDVTKTGQLPCKAVQSASQTESPQLLLAVYNEDEITKFIDQANTDAKAVDWNIARCVLIHIYNAHVDYPIGNDVGISDTDLVENGSGEFKQLKDAMDSKWGYKFSPTSGAIAKDIFTPGGGVITGSFGYCNSNNYKLQKAMRSYGWIILLALTLGSIGIMLFVGKENEEKEEHKGALEKII